MRHVEELYASLADGVGPGDAAFAFHSSPRIGQVEAKVDLLIEMKRSE